MKLILASLLFSQLPVAGSDWAEAYQKAMRLREAGNFDGSLSALTLSRAAAHTSRQTAMSLLEMGFVHFEMGKFREAERAYLTALALWEKPDPPNFDRGIAWSGLGGVYLRTGEFSKAERLARLALQEREQEANTSDVDVSGPLQNLAAVLQAEHRYPEAKDLYSRAIALKEKDGGVPRSVAAARGNLAMVLAQEGDFDGAIEEARKATSLWQAGATWDQPQLAVALDVLADIYCQAKRWKEAEDPVRRAQSILAGTFGNRHPTLAPILRTYAKVLSHTGRKREAKQMIQTADEIARESSSANLIGYTVDASRYR